MIRRALFGITSLVVTFALLLAPTLHSQTAPASVAPGPPGSDALPFLTELFSRYAHATIYHLEYTEEAELKGEFMRNWHKTTGVVVVGPRNQYRFQHRGESGQALQLSDGTTEWIYSPGLNQYTQQPTPSDGPSKIRTSASMALQRLSESQSTVHSIARRGELIQRASFVPDRDIQIGDKTVPCVVVTTEGVLPGSDGHITTTFTFWVEKQSGLIRKSVSRTEGELLGSSPGAPYVSEDERIYTIATLNPSSFPDGTFTFTPPATAVLVKQFTTKESQELPALLPSASGGRFCPLTKTYHGSPLTGKVRFSTTVRTKPGFVHLLDSFARPAVAASPIRALRAGFSVGVVDTFFVRTADDAVSNDNGFDFV